MKIGNLLVNAAYLGSKVLTAIAVGATKVWEGVSKYIKFADPVVEQLCMKWSSDGIGLTPEDAAKVTDIGTTFQGNTEITSFDELEKFTGIVSIGSLTEIAQNGVFYGCSNLKSIRLSSSTRILGARTFTRCSSLENINIPRTVTQVGHYTFAHVPANMVVDLPLLESIERYSTGIQFIGTWYNSGVTRIESFGNPIDTDNTYTESGVTYGVFSSCKSLEYANLTKLQNVGDNFFYNCSALKELIATQATRLGASCCKGCSSLTDITLSENLISIGNFAFENCTSLREFVIPSSVNSINGSVWKGCTSLSSVVVLSSVPCRIWNSFSESTCVIYVPDESVDAYKSATNWSAYADRIKPLSEYVEPTNE